MEILFIPAIFAVDGRRVLKVRQSNTRLAPSGRLGNGYTFAGWYDLKVAHPLRRSFLMLLLVRSSFELTDELSTLL